MKKILALILCLTTILSLSGCYSSESKKLAEEIRNEAKQMATEYIKDKYGFTPKIINVDELAEGSEYSIMRTPVKLVSISMEYKGHKFETFVDGKYRDGKCYDNYEQEKLEKSLEEYIISSFPYDIDLKVTTLAGYQQPFTPYFMARNLINEKVSDNIWATISNEEDPVNVYYIVEFSSPENIAEKLQRQDFEELYFLPDNKLGEIERRIIFINYWNKEDIGKISPEYMKFGRKQEEFYTYDNCSIYAKEIKIINTDLFQDGGGTTYIKNPKPVDYGEYILQTDEEIDYIDSCSDKIKDLEPKHPYSNAKEIIGCHYIRTKNKDANIKIYVKKKDVGYKSNIIKENMVFVTETNYGLRHHSGDECGEYIYTNVLGTKSGMHKFYLVKNKN